MTHETNTDDLPGLTVMRARDGDMLVVMDGADLAAGKAVDLRLADGALSVSQGDATAVAGGPVGAALGRDLARARRVTIVEVFPGDTPEADRFVMHGDVRISLHHDDGSEAVAG